MSVEFSNTYQEILLDNLVSIIKQNFIFQTQLKLAEGGNKDKAELQEKYDTLFSQYESLKSQTPELEALRLRADTNAGAHEEKSRIQSALNDEMRKNVELKRELEVKSNELAKKIVELEEAKKAQELLGAGKLISASNLDQEALRPLQLLTAKPFLYVFNVDAAELGDEELKKKLQAMIAPSEAIFLDAKTEAELAELEEADALELLQSIGMEEPGLATLARVGFETLGLQTYLTAGPKEARAWTIHKGDTAPVAAGVIHTDFQKGFIKAEIVSFADLISAGTMTEARSRGKVRMEGKEYVMADGDVVEFRFNV